MIKSFYNISWPVTEDQYRADSALSYSILSKYEKSGFNSLDTLFDKIETPSLTFGSAVDSLITGGKEEFESRFAVAHFPPVTPGMAQIVKKLFDLFSNRHKSLIDIPDGEIVNILDLYGFQTNWKLDTRINAIKTKGSQYYSILYNTKGKTLLDVQTYDDVIKTADALKTSEATYWYFKDDSPFENIERLYQLKFKSELDGIMYRCMADLIIIDHDAKTVQPIDLKTSSKKEWDFYKSFIDWRYDIQARLYWRIIRACMDKDEYFKNFKLLPYKFIVANRSSLTPLVWDFKYTEAKGTLKFGSNNQIELRDPFDIGKELSYYLENRSKVPIDIDIKGSNDLITWLNKL